MRISGAEAFGVASRIVNPFRPEIARTVHLARAVEPETGETLDQVLCTVFTAPDSYTGEDVVELSTHGGLLVPAAVLEAVFQAGARQARPGEFTLRSVANGKMDLLQAEAVADLVNATARAQGRAAISQLDRGLSLRVDELRSRAIELEALLSYEIDFPEEDDGPIPATRITAAAETLAESIDSLLGTARDGETLRQGALAVIAGRPNSGKSSLFNALVGYERAIVTDIAGTTRDAIEAPISCEGFPFRLVDTAGIRDSDDTVERLGVEVSRRYLDAADLVILCVEANRDFADEEVRFKESVSAPVVTVSTKADLVQPGSGTRSGIPVSALQGKGLTGLRGALAAAAFSGKMAAADLEPELTRARHRTALTRARAEIGEFLQSFSSGIEGVVTAVHVRSAISALEEIVGVVTTNDVLDAVFSEFCIGK